MIRIRFTAADFARVRFATRPAPLQELNVALLTLCGRNDRLLLDRWRGRLLRTLPPAALPLRDLVPAGAAPSFLDVLDDSLEEALDAVRAPRRAVVRSEIEQVYAASAMPPPPWVRSLHRGDADAWRVLRRAQRAAFDTVVEPVWHLLEDLHAAEFARHALTVAERGLGLALDDLVPGARLQGDVWELAASEEREVDLDGRGVVLLPTFHHAGTPLISDLPGRPVAVAFPAGPGLPLPAAVRDRDVASGGVDRGLIGVIGPTRHAMLLLLADEHTTSQLARRLGVSAASASAQAAALRAAGLITTSRAGRAVVHRRTALGTLLVGRDH